ncbi:NAD(P)H-dependent oxidoreductase [Fulvivirgaceae bacterium BMA10]|uniref:NAD(P)H-dependent oxidoreductase n=1 Tax=Splendidivirga corallicola TaxID=3051826 RepID=A0ABT8KV98_9BACT|nr:NAD(P)H-dependent oxidoreductase [Fulvivirgaceae bacterium BMA10]
MNKLVAFGASNSSRSINKQLAHWVSTQYDGADVDLLDLNDFEMPIYSMDREQQNGIPEQAYKFKEALKQADGIIISFAEHNGSYTAAFKNLFDWASRIEKTMWLNKPMFLLATSPGPRGAKGVLSGAVGAFPYQGGQVAASFSLPSFNQNFAPTKGILDQTLNKDFEVQLENFKKAIHETKTETTSTPS